jgi:hypothetical protein
MRRMVKPLLILPTLLWYLLVSPGVSPQESLDAKTAYKKRLSEIPLIVEGQVVKILEDDLQGRRHQRFIIRTDEGQTLLITHNIDIAPRVVMEMGTKVRVRGEYLWNLQGGIIHKTHRDQKEQISGGWIEVMTTGKRYE